MKVLPFWQKSYKMGGHNKVILGLKIFKNCKMTSPPTIRHGRVRSFKILQNPWAFWHVSSYLILQNLRFINFFTCTILLNLVRFLYYLASFLTGTYRILQDRTRNFPGSWQESYKILLNHLRILPSSCIRSWKYLQDLVKNFDQGPQKVFFHNFW